MYLRFIYDRLAGRKSGQQLEDIYRTDGQERERERRDLRSQLCCITDSSTPPAYRFPIGRELTRPVHWTMRFLSPRK